MPTRLLATLVVFPALMLTGGASRAQTQAAPASPQSPASQQSPAPSPPAPQTPAAQPPVPDADRVYQAGGRDRIAIPRVLREVKAGYTPEAMRNRIQGSVSLQAVVERDGSVSGVTVTQSLDSQFGLDEAAVNALRQWSFQPGTTPDGNPVRVLINVELTFTLRNGPIVQGWPDGFRDAVAPPGAVEEVTETGGLRLKLSRPPDWIAGRAAPGPVWLQVQSADLSESFSVFRPDGANFDLRDVPPAEQPARLRTLMGQVALSPQVQPLAAGQVQVPPDVLWVWSAVRLPSVSSLPGGPQNGLLGEARSWIFARAASGRVVLVQGALVFPRDIDPAAVPPRLQKAAEDFAGIIKSISVEAIN